MFRNTKLAVVLACAVAVAAFAGEAQASSRHAPLGYQLMCLKTPAECEGGGKAQVKATTNVLATLKRVNASVNRSIKPQNDSGADVWNASATTGDCEDYVLAKRRQLINAGIPASSLRIAYVKTRSGVGHAVLVVNTNNVKYVLDNLTNAIKPLSQTGYRVVSMQGANPRNWS